MLLLYRVRDIFSRRTLWQRIFGVGTITISSSDKTNPTLILQNIKRPLEVKKLIHKTVEENKLRRRVRIGEVIGSTDDDDNDLDPDDYDGDPLT